MYKYRLYFDGVVVDAFDNPYEWHTIAAAVTVAGVSLADMAGGVVHEYKPDMLQAIADDCGVDLDAVR